MQMQILTGYELIIVATFVVVCAAVVVARRGV